MLDLEYTTLGPNPYSLGLATEFISRFKPFSEFSLGASINAVAFQLQHGLNLVLSRNDVMVGYVGWVPANQEVALDWLRIGGLLTPDMAGDTVVITIVAAIDAAAVRSLLRRAKTKAAGKNVYWQRYFEDGRLATFRQLSMRARP